MAGLRWNWVYELEGQMAFCTTVATSRPDPAASLLAAGTITKADVARLRADVFKDGIVSRDEAELMFALNDGCKHNDPAWMPFFVEGLTDYLIWRTEPHGHVSEEDARFLIERIRKDGRIDARAEFELLVNVIDRASSCPAELILLALATVRDVVLQGNGLLFGPKRRRAGVIDGADVEALRTILYGQAGDGSLRVSRREADLLFDLNDATQGADNAPAWQDLFVQAIACHLTNPQGAARLPTRAEALEHQRWLESRSSGVGSILAGMASEVISGGFRKAFAAADLFGASQRLADTAKAAAETAAEAARAAIDEAEAGWLLARIPDSRDLDENERALLSFIKADCIATPPSLAPLLQRAGL